jgi:hypothetical protein
MLKRFSAGAILFLAMLTANFSSGNPLTIVGGNEIGPTDPTPEDEFQGPCLAREALACAAIDPGKGNCNAILVLGEQKGTEMFYRAKNMKDKQVYQQLYCSDQSENCTGNSRAKPFYDKNCEKN